jgi:hypothetical protein
MCGVRCGWSLGMSYLAVMFVVGCGKSDNVEVYPVKGIVNFNGKPMVGGGSIAFIPKDNQEGKTAGGTINADGSYELQTYDTDGFDGSMAGEFRVLITQVVVDEPENTGDSDETGGGAREAVSVVEEADRVPQIYSDPVGSPLTAKVEAKDPNVINFDLPPQ